MAVFVPSRAGMCAFWEIAGSYASGAHDCIVVRRNPPPRMRSGALCKGSPFFACMGHMDVPQPCPSLVCVGARCQRGKSCGNVIVFVCALGSCKRESGCAAGQRVPMCLARRHPRPPPCTPNRLRAAYRPSPWKRAVLVTSKVAPTLEHMLAPHGGHRPQRGALVPARTRHRLHLL